MTLLKNGMPDRFYDSQIAEVAFKAAKEVGVPITPLETVTEEQVTRVERAIFFVVAVWSGPALMRYREFLAEIAARDHTGVKIFVVDHDGLQEDFIMTVFRQLLHGGGEFFWVLKGSVLGSFVNYGDPVGPAVGRALESLQSRSS